MKEPKETSPVEGTRAGGAPRDPFARGRTRFGTSDPLRAGARAADPPPFEPPPFERDPANGRAEPPASGPDQTASSAPHMDWRDQWSPPGFDDYDLGPAPLRGSRVPDLSPVFLVLDALRKVVPAELHEQFNALVREVLQMVRSLIDWYLERIDGEQPEPRVEDIPID